MEKSKISLFDFKNVCDQNVIYIVFQLSMIL